MIYIQSVPPMFTVKRLREIMCRHGELGSISELRFPKILWSKFLDFFNRKISFECIRIWTKKLMTNRLFKIWNRLKFKNQKRAKIHLLTKTVHKFGHLFLVKAEKRGPQWRKRYTTEGWVEYKSKKVAKEVARLLNGQLVGGRRRSAAYDSIWTMKYNTCRGPMRIIKL